jgi:prolyl-tRNA editing enzyme YbaK/EbsC (Cys-tRNA(Pro) deacylase)
MSLVTRLLEEHHVRFKVLRHLPASTSLGEARVLGVPAGSVAKTLVLDTPRGHALAVIPASRRLDPRLAERAVGMHHVRLAPEAEIEHDFPRFELGALPPLASLLDAKVYVDSELAVQRWVFFATGSRDESVRVRTRDLIALDSAAVVRLTSEPVGREYQALAG